MQNTNLNRRIAAMLYDALLVLALLFMATLPFIALRGGEPVEADENFLYQGVLALVIYVFFVGFWTRSGRTLGMQSWRLQLESMDGQPPTLAVSTLRFFAAILSWLPLGLGFLWQLWDKDKLTWHDRISKTHIVYYPKESLGRL
ncbi:MAG: RDD family protein [Gammaproteobacteria bacterium]|nr:RDD family protein [Gammaproteobacteria bacterium]MDH5239411.1 RDD family protein [Gammaproteobacteria bacterium]MDH5260013.1 RDD family protein [Gammaproteobacteria bacterium]MDH5584109.1 RDD family protein [Gammaproteobacteria bacterium]